MLQQLFQNLLLLQFHLVLMKLLLLLLLMQ
jgi:hypothetical protein